MIGNIGVDLEDLGTTWDLWNTKHVHVLTYFLRGFPGNGCNSPASLEGSLCLPLLLRVSSGISPLRLRERCSHSVCPHLLPCTREMQDSEEDGKAGHLASATHFIFLSSSAENIPTYTPLFFPTMILSTQHLKSPNPNAKWCFSQRQKTEGLQATAAQGRFSSLPTVGLDGVLTTSNSLIIFSKVRHFKNRLTNVSGYSGQVGHLDNTQARSPKATLGWSAAAAVPFLRVPHADPVLHCCLPLFLPAWLLSLQKSSSFHLQMWRLKPPRAECCLQITKWVRKMGENENSSF